MPHTMANEISGDDLWKSDFKRQLSDPNAIVYAFAHWQIRYATGILEEQNIPYRLQDNGWFCSIYLNEPPPPVTQRDLKSYCGLKSEAQELALMDGYEEEHNRLKEKLTAIEEFVSQIHDPLYRQVIRLRYLKGHKWEQIAQKTGYSKVHVHRLHNLALKK